MVNDIEALSLRGRFEAKHDCVWTVGELQTKDVRQEVKIGSSQAAGKFSRNGGRSLDLSEEDRDIARP